MKKKRQQLLIASGVLKSGTGANCGIISTSTSIPHHKRWRACILSMMNREEHFIIFYSPFGFQFFFQLRVICGHVVQRKVSLLNICFMIFFLQTKLSLHSRLLCYTYVSVKTFQLHFSSCTEYMSCLIYDFLKLYFYSKNFNES